MLAAFAVALPKSGRWMDAVKSIGGMGLLFAAIYYLRPFMPWLKHVARPELWFLAASIAMAIVGIAIGAVHLSFHGPWSERLRARVPGVALVLARCARRVDLEADAQAPPSRGSTTRSSRSLVHAPSTRA